MATEEVRAQKKLKKKNNFSECKVKNKNKIQSMWKKNPENEERKKKTKQKFNVY